MDKRNTLFIEGLKKYIESLTCRNYKNIESDHHKIMGDLGRHKPLQIVEIKLPPVLIGVLNKIYERGCDDDCVFFSDFIDDYDEVQDIVDLEYEIRLVHDYIYDIAEKYNIYDRLDTFTKVVVVEISNGKYLNACIQESDRDFWFEVVNTEEDTISGGIIRVLEI